MGYARCVSGCESPQPSWQYCSFDFGEALNQNWYAPQGKLRCAISTWAAGNPRLGFNVLHGEGGSNCYAIDNIRLVGFTLFQQPWAK